VTITPFKPAWWLPGPHLQTLWPTFSRSQQKKLPLIRERIELPDGDFVDLDWMNQSTQPIVLLLHGLEGSANSPYMQGMLRALEKNNWRAVVMHFRGCSGEPNRFTHAYHSGETGDISAVVDLLRQREPHTPIAAIGFSLGGNVLLKWLGETHTSNPLTAAVAVSVPFQLSEVATRLEKGFSRVYQWHLLKSLREKMREKFLSQKNTEEHNSLADITTLRQFDEKVTAPLHGFNGANDYYEKCSSRQFLKTIAVPTLLLQAEDDPFMTDKVIPDKNELSATTEMIVTDHGGHVGFVEGKFPWRPEYWLERCVPEFIGRYFRVL
jgi:predicted alpha/beta-fold hydrolase